MGAYTRFDFLRLWDARFSKKATVPFNSVLVSQSKTILTSRAGDESDVELLIQVCQHHSKATITQLGTNKLIFMSDLGPDSVKPIQLSSEGRLLGVPNASNSVYFA